MKITRREFGRRSSTLSAAALLSGAVGTRAVPGRTNTSHPNILLLLVDQQHVPPLYGSGYGAAQGLKEILGFRPLSPDNAFAGFLPGFLRLRQNAVVFGTHYTAAAACVPARTCLMTSSYSTGVEQTDGMFKTAEDVPFLDPYGTPTIGDWFRAAGYTTHYFGKWHVSHPELIYPSTPGSLDEWGFSNWESTYPEPHGGDPYNIGLYRDPVFADNLIQFLEGKRRDYAGAPWLAVGSLVNPHDNGLYPWTEKGIVPWVPFPPPPGIPGKGEMSLPNPDGLKIKLNPDGFPQESYSLPQTFHESLETKPRCQKDYSFKFGLMTRANMEYVMLQNGITNYHSPYPFQMTADPQAWALAYAQFYMYCIYLADRQLNRILYALDHYGLTENTIVVFLSDHGEMAGAHGCMIQKWHNAYEESVRMPMIVSSPLVNGDKERMRTLVQPTSSIDLAPTLLGFAGYRQEELLAGVLANHRRSAVKPFAGVDLSSYATGERSGDIPGPDGKPRAGVLYMSNDMITELGHTREKQAQYDLYVKDVDAAIAQGYPVQPKTVMQPNNVRALCTGDWKIVRYTDPDRMERDEWELYCLKTDPIESINLVDFASGKVRNDVTVPSLTREELIRTNKELQQELARQEAACIKYQA